MTDHITDVPSTPTPRTTQESCQHGADPHTCPACEQAQIDAAQAKKEAENAEWDLETTKARRAEAKAYINENYNTLKGNPRMKQIVEDAVGYSLDTLNHHVSRHGLDGGN